MSQQFPIPRTTRGPIVYVAYAGQTVVPFPWYLTEAQDAEIRLGPADGGAFAAPLVADTDFTAAGLGNAGGATLNLTTPLTAGTRIRVRGKRLPSRMKSVVLGGSVRAIPLELELDLLNTTQQELRRDVDANEVANEALILDQAAQDAEIAGHAATLADHEARLLTADEARAFVVDAQQAALATEGDRDFIQTLLGQVLDDGIWGETPGPSYDDGEFGT